MITREGKLQIFESFVINTNLPKHKISTEGSSGFKSARFSSSEEDFGIHIMDGTGFITQVDARRSGWFNHLLLLLNKWFRKPKEPKPSMTIKEFFYSVKNSSEELEAIIARASGYEAALNQAYLSHQQALFEKLSAGLQTVRVETQLIAKGLSKYVSEETLVGFVKKCPKGLRLDWIANFTRVIPSELVARMIALDELRLFDNYVVLHYDPLKKSWAETEKETAARKDPILFGVLKDSRKLYYIGDWVDEFCDLTLDQIAETMGNSAVESIPVTFVP